MPELGVGHAGDDEEQGYLRKKSSKGRWQRRFFETQGHYFVYRKDAESPELLASMDMSQVSEVNYNEGTTDFVVQFGERGYQMRGSSVEDAERWVKVLAGKMEAGVTATPSPKLKGALCHVFASRMRSPLPLSPPGSSASSSSTLKSSLVGSASRTAKPSDYDASSAAAGGAGPGGRLQRRVPKKLAAAASE